MTAPVIDYAPPRRRRWRVWSLVAVLLIAAGALGWYRDPPWRSANLAYHGYHAGRAFEHCATLTLPTDRPLYVDQGDVADADPLGPHRVPINLREVRPDLLPTPSVLPSVAPVRLTSAWPSSSSASSPSCNRHRVPH